MASRGGEGGAFAQIPDWAILLTFCLLFSAQVVWTIHQKSATFDEPLNLVSGYISLRFGDDRLIPQNLPLVKLLAAAPLFIFRDIALPPSPEPWSKRAQYRYASELLYQLNDADTLLFVGRLAVLPLSLLLGCFVFRWAKQLVGRAGAAFALLLYSFEPNILAHSGLITTDIATSCFLFLTLYGWYQLAQGITWPRVLLPALTFGLGLITKFTILPLVLMFLLLAGFIIFDRQPLRVQLGGLAPRTVEERGGKVLLWGFMALVSALVAFAVIWAAYGFRYESALFPVFSHPNYWRDILPSSPFLIDLVHTARQFQLLPETYLYGLTFALQITGGFTGYLMEEIRDGGWWYYFLVTFSIKTPIPLILLVVLALWGQWRMWVENPLRAAFIFGPIVIYSVMITISGWNIGHRHLLPIYPFLFILAGSLVPWATRRGRWVKAGLAGLACWYVLSSAWISPHYLAYFNELVGGPDRGSRYLVDSNLDWGQDLKGLKRYMDEHGIERVWLSYFGQADPEYHGITYDYLPSFTIYDRSTDRSEFWDIDRMPLMPGLVAISATLLEGVYLPVKDPVKARAYFEEYRRMTPVAKIGHSIFIYRVE